MAGNQGVYLTGPFGCTTMSICGSIRGTFQASNDHSRYVGANQLGVRPNEALISAVGATDVGIVGAGIVDGAGGGLQPNGSPSWWALKSPAAKSARPWLIEFYQCDHVMISGVTLQNSPMWTQVLRFSSNITVSGLKVTAPPLPRTPTASIWSARAVTLEISISASVMTTSRSSRGFRLIRTTRSREVCRRWPLPT